MKTYRSPRQVIAELEEMIAAEKPSAHSPSLLVRAAKLLRESRNYYRVGIYLVINDRVVRQAVCGPELPQSGAGAPIRPEIAAPLKVATQFLGTVRAEGDRPHAFAAEDRVLLKHVGGILALYLAGKGKYLVRKAREAVREAAAAVVEDQPPRAHQPASDKSLATPPKTMRRAAVGEKVHS